MIERVLISLALVAMLVLAYQVLQAKHRVRAGKSIAAQARGGPYQPSLLYFWGQHCAPCVTQAQFLQLLPEQVLDQIKIEKIDAEEERELAATYGVFTLPTTMLVDQTGNVRHVNYGLADPGKLTAQLESIL